MVTSAAWYPNIKNTMFVNHCRTSDKEATTCYSDDFGLLNGGPETSQAYYQVGYINDVMIELMNSLLTDINFNKKNRGRSPGLLNG